MKNETEQQANESLFRRALDIIQEIKVQFVIAAIFTWDLEGQLSKTDQNEKP